METSQTSPKIRWPNSIGREHLAPEGQSQERGFANQMNFLFDIWFLKVRLPNATWKICA